MKSILLLVALLFAAPAFADDVTIEWGWPTTMCNGTTLSVSDIQSGELYIDTVPIPSIIDTEGECSLSGESIAPTTVLQALTTAEPRVTVDLSPGVTYYFRLRVRHANGQWSNLSAQVSHVIPNPIPGVPIIIRIF